MISNIWNNIVAFFASIPTATYMATVMKVVWIIVIILGVKFATKSGNFFIKKFFAQQQKSKMKMEDQKATTMEILLQNILKYVVGFIGLIMILGQVGIDIGPLIATAGVGGIAIAFGAQALVTDVITGSFILFEDQFAVGDWIQIGDITGTVEEMGMRITKIRTYTGELCIITNGQIDKVINFSRGNSVAIVDMGISYETDIKRASEVMLEASKKYYQRNENMVNEPEVIGVVNLGESDVVIRLIAQTKPMTHYQVERDLRQVMKEAFDNQGVDIPYPHRVVINQ